MVANPGEPDAFSGMARPDEPSRADFADGAWMAAPEHRAAYRSWLRRGLHWQAALLAVRLPAYARHLVAFEAPLSPVDFLAAVREAEADRIPLDAVLARMGYRATVQSEPDYDPQEAGRRVNAARQAVYESYLTDAGVDPDDEAPARAPTAARSASGAPSGLSTAAQSAFRAAKGILGRSDTKTRPSHTPEARRQRHLRSLVERGIYPDVATADRLVPRRGLK